MQMWYLQLCLPCFWSLFSVFVHNFCNFKNFIQIKLQLYDTHCYLPWTELPKLVVSTGIQTQRFPFMRFYDLVR